MSAAAPPRETARGDYDARTTSATIGTIIMTGTTMRTVTTDAAYFPPRGDWARVDPKEAGFDPGRLAEAVGFAEANESPWPRSMYLDNGEYIGTADMGEAPPWNDVLGEVRPRGGAGGLVIRRGRMAAEWGDTNRRDMTFSIAKSYLAVLAGVAVARGLIRSIDDRVRDYALDDGFTSAQNRDVTWRHLLEQTSEWEGTLFDKPDAVDRHRQLGATVGPAPKGSHRDLQPPGTFWEYNDVRVNRLSLSLLQVFRRPLPEVLREAIMDPIGASPEWEWRGYRNSTVEIDGRAIESVSGGAHWGGGMFISARDHARLGYLIQRRGAWEGRQLLAEAWVDALTTPSALNPIYGLLWWLNTDRAYYPAAPATSFFAVGMGTNLIWIDPALDLLVVARWVNKARTGDLIANVMRALR
jgi:CubicO group peptidase (beta-lactamase class C family)